MPQKQRDALIPAGGASFSVHAFSDKFAVACGITDHFNDEYTVECPLLEALLPSKPSKPGAINNKGGNNNSVGVGRYV